MQARQAEFGVGVSGPFGISGYISQRRGCIEAAEPKETLNGTATFLKYVPGCPGPALQGTAMQAQVSVSETCLDPNEQCPAWPSLHLLQTTPFTSS